MAESKTHYYYALGRRKSATARIRLMAGKGNIVINGKPASEYLAGSKTLLHELERPFAAIETPLKGFDVTVVVSGGGHAGQVDAIRLGVPVFCEPTCAAAPVATSSSPARRSSRTASARLPAS